MKTNKGIDEQTISRSNITITEVKDAMKIQFNKDVNTPKKLLDKLNKDNKKGVLLATRCPECKSIFLHLCLDTDLYYYKQYELWNISWGEHTCPECNAYDTLFLQHHTGKVVFDNSGIPDTEFTVINHKTIKYCKTPLISSITEAF